MLASIKNLFYYFLFVTTLIPIKVEGSKHFFQEEFLQSISASPIGMLGTLIFVKHSGAVRP